MPHHPGLPEGERREQEHGSSEDGPSDHPNLLEIGKYDLMLSFQSAQP
jgi:hypothetical protein